MVDPDPKILYDIAFARLRTLFAMKVFTIHTLIFDERREIMPRVYDEVMNIPEKHWMEKYTLPNNMIINIKSKGAILEFGGEADVEIVQAPPSNKTQVPPIANPSSIQELD